MRALVTGGGGFLGRYVVEQLVERGDDVTSFSRSAYPELEEMGVHTIRGDLYDARAVETACAGIDTVFHVASRVSPWGSWEAFYHTNVIGTENVIAACRSQSVPKLVYTSTPSVVFANRSHRGADESLPYPEHYESHYAHTKAIAERTVRAANGQDGLLTVSLRPHLIVGPRDQSLVPRIVERAQTGRVPQIGDGTNCADLTYVEDAARAHLLAADALEPGSPAAGSVYFITQGDPVNAWGWLRKLLTALDLPPIRGRVPLWAAHAATRAIEFVYRVLHLPGEPILTRLLVSELATDHYYDISRAQRDLGYTPRIDIAEVTRRVIADMKRKFTPGSDARREQSEERHRDT